MEVFVALIKNISKKLFENNELIIYTLDNEILVEYLDDILLLDDISLGHYKLWYKENFQSDYPNKWKLSKIVLLKNKPVGYCIISSYCDKKAHIHRISIDPLLRGEGVGSILMQQVFFGALCRGIFEISLESLRDNVVANSFYNKLGFREFDENEVRKYIIDRKKIVKLNEFYAINKAGNRLVLSINLK